MAEKRGRHTDDPARNKVNLRLTDEEHMKLKTCSEVMDKSMADVIRRGIDIQYAEIEKEKRD